MLFTPNHHIEEIKAKDLIVLPANQRNEFIEHAFHYWREKGFPFRVMSAKEIKDCYENIRDFDTTNVISDSLISGSVLGLDLANSFHPQIWNAVRWGHLKSPLDHFHNDDTLRKLLERAIQLWPDRRCWSASVIRSIFRIYSGGRVSNFRPIVSKRLIELYSKEGETLLDFCAGFGGRLLGVMPLNRNYIGIDSSQNQVAANQLLFNTIKPYSKCSAEFHVGCAEEVMQNLRTCSINLVFTSPPYFKQEKYNNEINQSYLRYNNYEEWKHNFLSKVIDESYRLLKPKGFFVINISNIRGYPLAYDFEQLALKQFTLKTKYELVMVSRPAHRKSGTSHKTEPVYIYQKK